MENDRKQAFLRRGWTLFPDIAVAAAGDIFLIRLAVLQKEAMCAIEGESEYVSLNGLPFWESGCNWMVLMMLL